MKVRCNWCMSIFNEEQIVYDRDKDMEFCPVCGDSACLMDVPQDEFPQYYNDLPVNNKS